MATGRALAIGERRRARRAFSATAAVVLGTLLAGTAVAKGAADEALSLAIVLDDSGSMKRNDARRLSVTAAMIAVQLGGAADRVALVPLNGRATQLGRGGRGAPLLAQLARLSRRGVKTIYERPLRRALRLLAAAGGRRVVLFLTDGEPDAGPGAKREVVMQQQERYLEQLVSQPPRGVRIYPVLLGQLAPRWTDLFERVARASGGGAFRAPTAERLIEAFAQIYATTLGSKVVVKSVGDGRSELATIDDFVRGANLVVISREGRFTVRYPGGRGGGAARDNGRDRRPLAAGAQRPRPIYHFVDKLRPAKRLAVELRGGKSYRTLLIWDYDLALQLARPVAARDGSFPLRAHLSRRRPRGQPIAKRSFLEGVDVRARVCAGGCRQQRAKCRAPIPLRLSCSAGKRPPCVFVGSFAPPAPGSYCVDAVARRRWQGHQVLELPSEQRHRLAVSGGGRLSCGTARLSFACDQNADRDRWPSCRRLKLSLAGLARPARVDLDPSGIGLPAGVELRVNGSAKRSVLLRPGAPAEIEICLTPGTLLDRPGLTSKGKPLRLKAHDPRWFARDGAAVSVPVDVQITACSWWNRHKRLLLYLGLALLGLLFLIWLILGFVKPHGFPENLKVNWGKSIKRLDRNEMPVSEVPRSGRGFYRNAQLWIGGSRCFLQSGWPATARFEATSRRGIKVFAEDGADVKRIDKFDSERQHEVASGSPVTLGEIYLINDLYVRLEL